MSDETKSVQREVLPKHTPGPWAVMTYRHSDETGEQYAITSVIASPNISVTTVADLDECDANASLIAAAPDLLAELREAQKEISSYRAALLMVRDPLPSELHARKTHDARRVSAIAKAEGRE